MHQMEVINRRTWRNPLYLRDYRKAEGYLEKGERVLMEMVESHHPHGRILDIGCGGGRTTNLVKNFACDYLGVDYTAKMVKTARNNHPEIRFEQMDARDLSPIGGAAFDVALFSYNGIDSMDPSGRLTAFREVYRVLKPGGCFAFSSFNRNWTGFDSHSRRFELCWTVNPLRMGVRIARWAIGKFREHRYLRYEQRGEHAILLISAHDFGVMVYATTPSQIQQQLTGVGFSQEILILRRDGLPIKGEIEPENEYFHIYARKA